MSSFSSSDVQGQIQQLSRTLTEREAQLRSLRDEVALLESVSVSPSGSSAAVLNNSCVPPVDETVLGPCRHDAMPESFVEEMVKARDGLVDSRAQFEQLQKEKNDLAAGLRRTNDLTEKTTADLHKLYVDARWRPGSKTSYACPIALNDEASRQRKQLLEKYEEQRGHENVIKYQVKEMGEVVLQLEGMGDVEKMHYDAKTNLRIKKEKLRAIEDELKTCKRIYERKMKVYEKIDYKGEQRLIKDLEVDKRVVQLKLQGHKTEVKSNTLAVRHRALTIGRLQEKIQAIGEALSSNMEAEEAAQYEPVDASYIEDLKKEIDTLAKKSAEHEMMLDARDAEHEDLENRVRTLSKAISNTENQKQRVVQQRQMEKRGLEEEVLFRQEDDFRRIAELEDDISGLEEVLEYNNSSSRPATARE